VLFLLSPVIFVIAVTDAVFRHRSIRRSWTGVVGKAHRYLDFSHLLEKLRYLPLIRYTHRYKPDIIHVHGYGCGIVPAGGISAAALCRLPIVYSEHGTPWNGLQDSSKIIGDLKQVNSLIAISEDSAECIRKFCLRSSEIHIIRHIVPIPVVSPGVIKPQSSLLITITCVAMMRPQKGHAILLQAAAQVIESHPQTQFFLIGDGPTRSDLEKQACKLGISDQIIFKGVLSNSEVECSLQQTDIFVLPSFREALGVAMIEAMSYGLPVVGTNAGGLPDLVKNGKNGILVPPGNPEALADALRTLIENPVLRKKLGKAAQQSHARGEFTPQAVGDATLSVYREAVEIYHSQLGR
jgi:glycosyltransferase involved in cell wall biosynthesis